MGYLHGEANPDVWYLRIFHSGTVARINHMGGNIRESKRFRMIITTFNGINIIAFPGDVLPGVTAPSSIEFNPQERVGETDATFGYQAQMWDWMSSMWSAQVSFPPMTRYSYDAWTAFIMEARGGFNAFMVGDPKAALPKGIATGTPVVSGAGQTGYSLVTRGWSPNVISILLTGDHIQIGYRLYKVLDSVDSDGSGNATLNVWPNLRDQPADGTTIITRNCKGLFRLSNPIGNKFSVNVGNYGLSGFAIREAGVA